MRSIIFVPCNNGLGHIRRLSILANSLKTSKKIFFFLDIKKKNKFRLKNKIKKKFISKKIEKYFTYISKKINSKKPGIIFTDNRIDKKLIFNNTILYANFLWEEILNKKKINLKRLKEKKIKIFSNYLFSNIKAKIKIDKVGFFGKYRSNKDTDGILIATGSAKSKLLKSYKKKIIKILKKNKFHKKKIYLDPSIYDSSLKKYSVIKANFSNRMYSRISIAIIKPGMGTIEECLKRGIPIIPIMKNENKEFKYNTHVLVKENLGFDLKNFDQIIEFINKNISKTIFFNKFRLKCKNLKWNGELEIIKYLHNFTY